MVYIFAGDNARPKKTPRRANAVFARIISLTWSICIYHAPYDSTRW